jgi:hypothetical protein
MVILMQSRLNADTTSDTAMPRFWHPHEVTGVHIVTIGLDALLTMAIAADWPQASIHPKSVNPRCWDGPAPDLVVLNRAGTNHATLRAAVWQRWGPRVVVAEVDSDGPWSVIWRSPTISTVVEIGPGFLAPFVAAAHARV